MRTPLLFVLPLVGAVVGCSNARDDFMPVLSDAPFVYDIGELQPLTAEVMNVIPPLDYTAVPEIIHYGQLGFGENPGIYGGATFQFKGTGGPMCVVVDPESIFWNPEIAENSGTIQYKYEDIYEDDGDIDLSVGLTAYYTGSPGTDIGDFEAVFTDASGMPHSLEFNECEQVGLFGDPAHAGRATLEYCEIDTDLREGVSYTVLLETFALPIDDSILNYGAMVYDGGCGELRWRDPELDPEEDEVNNSTGTRQPDGIPDHYGYQSGATECTLPNEVANSEPDGVVADEKAWFPELEVAFCGGKGKVNNWCGDNAPEGCQELPEFQ